MGIFDSLKKPEFVENDARKIETEIINDVEKTTGGTIYPGDPKRLFVQGNAALITQERSLINYAGLQNLLAFVGDDFIDAYGANFGCVRIEPKAAKTTMRMILSIAQPYNITVPKGTKFTPDNEIFFATIDDLIILAGRVVEDVVVLCTTKGIAGNGFVAGQINKTVDYFAWLDNAKNLTTTDGGADWEETESYRSRIALSMERFSVAGPDGAYEYWSKTAHQDIIDVSVRSPLPGVVELRPLMMGGKIPPQEIIDAVYDTCNDRTIRPLTDYLTVLPPDVADYDIDGIYYISKEKKTIGDTIQKDVDKALKIYIEWQKSKLGRDINPSELINLVKNAGAKRLELTSPAFKKLERTQVAQDKTVKLIFGGYEND